MNFNAEISFANLLTRISPEILNALIFRITIHQQYEFCEKALIKTPHSVFNILGAYSLECARGFWVLNKNVFMQASSLSA